MSVDQQRPLAFSAAPGSSVAADLSDLRSGGVHTPTRANSPGLPQDIEERMKLTSIIEEKVSLFHNHAPSHTHKNMDSFPTL